MFRYPLKYDLQPSIWRYYKTPGFMKALKCYEEVTKIMKDNIEEAVKKFEANPTADDEETGVLEKLYRVDPHVAFVMALDALLAGVGELL